MFSLLAISSFFFHIDVAHVGAYSPLINSPKPIILVKYTFLLFISFARIEVLLQR